MSGKTLLNDYRIVGFEQSVGIQFPMRATDQSGSLRSTLSKDEGDKAKTIVIKTHLRFSEDKELTKLVQIAEAKNSKGERVVYAIKNLLVNAAGIKQCRFEGDIRIDEMTGLWAWEVTLNFTEVNSTTEKAEARKAKKKTAKAVQASGTAVTPKATEPVVNNNTANKSVTQQNEEALGPWEKRIKAVDDWLGK